MTDTTTAPPPAHGFQIVGDGEEYLAECSCGWASGWACTPEEADRAGVEHRDGAVGPGDRMDLLMSGLLDLQDDIASVVIWLAENWSADLPPLGWSACGSDWDTGRHVLRVLGACSPGELVTAAQVLGATLNDDLPEGNGHTRYRHATRDFGRVRIDLFTPLADALAAETGR